MREKRFNLAHRLIHWAIAFTMFYVLLTVLLRMGWMNKGHIGSVIQEQLSKAGTKISSDEAAGIGKAVRRPMWNTHIIAGYVMIGLYVLRMLLLMVQGVAFANPLSANLQRADKFKSWLYIVFYVLLGVSLITGFLVVNGPGSIHELMEEIHVLSLYYVVIFIVLHIGGVLIANAGTDKYIISKMISGDK